MNSRLGIASQITISLMDRNFNDGLDNRTFNDQTTLNPLSTIYRLLLRCKQLGGASIGLQTGGPTKV